jgi:hypothetical protein
MRFARTLGVLACLGLIACDVPHPSSPASVADPRLQRTAADDEHFGSVSGTGQYSINGLIVSFTLAAAVEKNGKGEGEFTLFADEGDGLTVSFAGKVICLAIDAENHRAWIGAKIKDNSSTDPTLQAEIHKQSRDIWFRVLDEASGDRSTFVGFEGSAGFITSEEYCAGRPWPADNARTWPVVSGGLSIVP